MTGIKLTELMKSVQGLSQPPIEVQPIGNGATPVVVPALTPESLVVVVDSLNRSWERGKHGEDCRVSDDGGVQTVSLAA